jgi:hypothetical protein
MMNIVLSIFEVAAILAVARGYINNFRFKHGNVVKNNVLPFRVQLTGSYYIDLLGTPELSYLSTLPQGAVVVADSIKNANYPVVCTGETAKLITALDSDAEHIFATKLTALERLVRAPGTSPADVTTLLGGWTGYVDTSDQAYDCKRMRLTPATDTPGAFVFTVEVEFNDYKPIVFVDTMGVGMFHYKRSYDTKHSGHASGNPIRFCGGVGYTGDMYTIENRPKCPIAASSEKARYHGRAVVTVYKPNIVSYRWNATRCIQTLTHVHAYENIFGTSRDAWRKHRTVDTSRSECEEWNRTLSACDTFKVRSIKDSDGIASGYSYYGNHPDQCKLGPQYSQNTAVNEFVSTPDLSYHYSGGSTYASDFRTGTLSRGFIEVGMPTGTMVTPWMNIPPEASQQGYYSVNNVTIIWKPIPASKMCKYVPRFRGEVSYIKYKHGDYNLPVDPTSDVEDYTLFLVADQYGALFNVDSSQKITDVSKFGCMPHKSDYRTSVYQTGSDQIIMVTVVDEGDPNHHSKSHIPEDVRHVGTEEQVHGAYGNIVYDGHTKQVMSVIHENQLTAIKPTVKGDASKLHVLKDHFNTVKTTDAPMAPAPPVIPAIPTTASAVEVLAYVEYQRGETQKYNLHVRAMQNCFMNQLDWDMYAQLLDLNPSRAISNRLNVAVEASLGGNGFYNVKMCELAVNVVIVPTMKTNSEERVTVNGKEHTVKDIVTHMGVRPDPEKCFAMPLLVFTSPITGIQVVGQLTLEGIINAQKLAYLEACGKNKAHLFMVNDYGHFFYEYVLNFTESAEVIKNATDRFLKASNPTMVIASSGLTTEQFKDHSLSKIHTLTVVQPANLKEKEYNHYPTGLFSNDIYSLAEHQSASLGLMKLMEEQNFERFSTREFNAEWNDDLGSTDAGLFSGMGNFAEGAGDFFMKVGQGTGSLLYGLGGGVGQAAKGVGEGVGKAGKGIFDGIGDALKGTFMALGLPLIAVAVLAIVGVIIYKQVTGKKTPPIPEDPPPYHQQQQNYDGGVTKRQGFNFN